MSSTSIVKFFYRSSKDHKKIPGNLVAFKPRSMAPSKGRLLFEVSFFPLSKLRLRKSSKPGTCSRTSFLVPIKPKSAAKATRG